MSNIRPYSPSAIRKLVSNISSNPAELFVSHNYGCSLGQMGRAYVTRPKRVWEMQQSHWNLQKFLCPSRMASERARRGCMDAGECIVPDGAYHAKRRNEHVYQRAVFRFADRYLPRLPLFPLFIICPAYDAMVGDSVVVEFRVEALRAGIHHHQPWLVGK